MYRRFSLFILALLICFLLPTILKAEEDPVLNAIGEAVQYYKNNQFSEAAASLDSAGQMIRRKKGGALGKLLPEPLSGWFAQQDDSKALGTSMFGGAITAERQYTKNDSSITIKFSTDSPMMQSMLMMFNNPVFASSAGKIELINGQKAIVDFKETLGSVNIVIGKNLLITIEGIHTNREDLMAYAGKLDMDKLAKLP